MKESFHNSNQFKVMLLSIVLIGGYTFLFNVTASTMIAFFVINWMGVLQGNLND